LKSFLGFLVKLSLHTNDRKPIHKIKSIGSGT